MTRDLLDVLTRMSEFLDNYVDVVDGDDGQPRPNRAMSLKTDVDEAVTALAHEVECTSPCIDNYCPIHGIAAKEGGQR